MKLYPKTYEDVYNLNPEGIRVEKIGSTIGSAEELAEMFRTFYFDAHRQFFDMAVKQVWLEQHFKYGDIRRYKRWGNGYANDWAYGYFMKTMVGTSQKPITSNFSFGATVTYLKILFPDFMKHNPFLENEYFKYPYNHVTLDHMVFVYMMHDRMEMLEYAEKNSLSFAEFANWAVNQAFCYNDEVGKSIYVLVSDGYKWPHISNRSLPKDWRIKMCDMDTKKQPRVSGLKTAPIKYKKLRNI